MRGPKLNRDWVGLTVRLTRRVTTQLVTHPAGTRGTVTQYAGYGIEFTADKCDCCGAQARVIRLARADVQIITARQDWPDTRARRNRS